MTDGEKRKQAHTAHKRTWIEWLIFIIGLCGAAVLVVLFALKALGFMETDSRVLGLLFAFMLLCDGAADFRTNRRSAVMCLAACAVTAALCLIWQ